MPNLAPDTKSKLVILLGLPIEELISIKLDQKLSDLETYDSGSLIAGFEALINDAIALESSLKDSSDSISMVKADVVEWKNGKGLGTISQLNAIKSKLKALLKLDLVKELSSNTFIYSRSILDVSPWQ